MMALSGVRISWLILARKSDFADDARSASRLGGDQLLLHLLPRGDIAEHRAVFVALVAEPAHGDEQRDQATLALESDDLASVVEQRGDAFALQAIEIVDGDADALRREQFGEAASVEFVRVVAEQRLRAAVRRQDARRAINHDDTVGGGVEDRVDLRELRAQRIERRLRRRSGARAAWSAAQRRPRRPMAPAAAALRRRSSRR